MPERSDHCLSQTFELYKYWCVTSRPKQHNSFKVQTFTPTKFTGTAGKNADDNFASAAVKWNASSGSQPTGKPPPKFRIDELKTLLELGRISKTQYEYAMVNSGEYEDMPADPPKAEPV